MLTVEDGVLEELPGGGFEAALQTDRGPVFLSGGDMQSIQTSSPHEAVSSKDILDQLCNPSSLPSVDLVLQAEFVGIPTEQREAVLRQLRRYIDSHRNSNDQAIQVAVAAAIRKYVANVPLACLNELAGILEADNRSPPPVAVELEVAKMVHRNLQAFPPADCDPHPDLAARLSEIATTYINPRLLSRENYGAVALSAVLGMVALRSGQSRAVLETVSKCGQAWFQEAVQDALGQLLKAWSLKSPTAAEWLRTACDNWFQIIPESSHA